MNSIIINYKIVKYIDKNKFQDIINGCISNKYKVFLNFYDFSLVKNIKNYLDNNNSLSNVNISVHEHDYEDFTNSDTIILNNLIRHGDSIAFGMFQDNLVINHGVLDSLDLEILKQNSYGLVYFDYTINNIRCFLRSRVMNIKLNVPAVFWSTSKLIRYIAENDKLNIVANNFAAIHIPNSLCKIYTDDN